MNTTANEATTLRLACDCEAEGCATWLELTHDGFLILEDKDGCRVSLMLPDWLEAAMRRSLQEDHQTQTNQARPTAEVAEPQPPDKATLWQWVDAYGLCTATDGCWVEPDGTCEHGHLSWLVVLGLV